MKRARWLPVLPLLLALPCARAASLDILGSRIDLPFAFDVASRTTGIQTRGKDLSGDEAAVLDVRDASGKTWKVRIDAGWLGGPDIADVASPALGEPPAVNPGVREKTMVRIDDADFGFVDTHIDNAKYARILRWRSALKPIAYQITVALPDGFPLAEPLVKSIQAIHIDRAALAKAKADAQTEVDGASHDNRLVTPLGEIAMHADLDTDFHLLVSLTTRDAAGRPSFRRRMFVFTGGGYLTANSGVGAGYRLDVGCGKLGALEVRDAERFIAMSDEAAIEDPKRQYSDIVARPAQTLLGLPAQVSAAHIGATGSDMARFGREQRWLAKNGDTWFMISANHFNTRPIEEGMLRQLAAGPAVCHYDLDGVTAH